MDPNTCATFRPDWDGTPVTAVNELITLVGAPISLILIAATVMSVRSKSAWGSLVVVVAWSLYVSFLTMIDPGGMFAAGRAEGCVGSPTLFIGVVAAICVAMILFTAPRETRTHDGDT